MVLMKTDPAGCKAGDLPEIFSVIDDIVDALLRRAAADLSLQVRVEMSTCLQAYLCAHFLFSPTL